MTTTSRPAIGFAVLGAILVSSSLSANALTVGRCNSLVDGVYVPVLIVKNGDQKTVHQIGTDGLTRRIVFDTDAALDWAASVYNVEANSTDYSDACHKNMDGTEAVVIPVVVVEEEEEEEEDDYGGEGEGEEVIEEDEGLDEVLY